MKNIEQYLPSEKFRKFLLYTFIILCLFGLISLLLNKRQKFVSEKNIQITNTKTIEDYLKQDVDKDGIYDWEEEIWGTDKTRKNTFGISDKEYIKNKKAELQISEEVNFDELNETDRFARELFSTYAALKSSGEVDDLTIAGLYNSLGQKIVSQNIVDKYKETDLIISEDEDPNIYYNKMVDIFDKYREAGLGNEVSILGQDLLNYSTTNTTNGGELILISETYRNFAEEVLSLGVPEIIKKEHLILVNSANNLSVSVFEMSKVVNDPIVGLSGISQYQKYSEEMAKAIEDIELILEI